MILRFGLPLSSHQYRESIFFAPVVCAMYPLVIVRGELDDVLREIEPRNRSAVMAMSSSSEDFGRVVLETREELVNL